MLGVNRTKALLLASVAGTAALAAATSANAGGFAVREQSAEFQGMSWAGNAAGGSLSSMFWNSAAAASRDGMNIESSTSILLPRAEVTIDKFSVGALLGGNAGPVGTSYKNAPATADGIAPTALVAATYGNYQVGNLYIGMAVNAPFGLTTEPNNYNYQGATLAQTSKLMAFNFNPTVAMKVMPGVTIGVGAQIQTAEGTFRFASGSPTPTVVPGTGATSSFEGNGWGFGATAGVIVEPMAGTSIGVGYRSQMTQEIDGLFTTAGGNVHGVANLELPDIVTVSIKQVVSPVMRLAGTFEWSNWSRFTALTITANEQGKSSLGTIGAGGTVATIPLSWSDGWMASIGGEYDLSRTLTVRAGFAYEKSPVDDPTKRAISIPDANRYWMSFGGSWRALENTTIDLAWSHVFIEDSTFDRNTTAPYATPTAFTNLQGSIKASLDIISLGVKTHW